MSKFSIFTIDLRVIWWIIVVTGVYVLLLKFLQKNSPHNVQTNTGVGGSKAFLTMLEKLHFSCLMASLNGCLIDVITFGLYWLPPSPPSFVSVLQLNRFATLIVWVLDWLSTLLCFFHNSFFGFVMNHN